MDIEKSQGGVIDDDWASFQGALSNLSAKATGLKKSGLNERAILVLLKDATKLRMSDIKCVLDALPMMNAMYGSNAGDAKK